MDTTASFQSLSVFICIVIKFIVFVENTLCIERIANLNTIHTTS